MRKFIWIFGDAVQDITVEAELDPLLHPNLNIHDLIRLEKVPRIKRGIWLSTQLGGGRYAVEIRIPLLDEVQKERLTQDGFYSLEAGQKYTLASPLYDTIPDGEHPLKVSGEKRSWGGGGLNVATFLRGLSPYQEKVSIKYTDIAMSRDFSRAVQVLENIFQARPNGPARSVNPLSSLVSEMVAADLASAEATINSVAQYCAQFRPELCLEMYLASIPVELVLYRPQSVRMRRNWVFSRLRSGGVEVRDKIILRESRSPLDPSDEQGIANLMRQHMPGVGAILLNSLKDGELFRAAYKMAMEATVSTDAVVLVAMTGAMQEFKDWMVEQHKEKIGFPPFIFVFNEQEAYQFARRFDPSLQPFMESPDDLPHIDKFVKIALKLREQWHIADDVPRMYFTVGARGSLGVDRDGTVVAVSCYSRLGDTLFDTNACGDAYCAAITLLEWAKRNGYPSVADRPGGGRLCDAEEMEYFMAVASATAYCKAASRHGRVACSEVQDLLENVHVATAILPSVRQLVEGARPPCVDNSRRLRKPQASRAVGVTPQLRELLTR